MKFLLAVSFVFLMIGYSCKKKEKSSTDSSAKLFTFNSLRSDKDTIKQGDVTNVRAQITGQGTASWAASAGDVFGSGVTVLFGASTCCVGNHTINCTIKDEHNNSETKSITVFVKQ